MKKLPEQSAPKKYWVKRFVEGMPFSLYRERQLEDLKKFGSEPGIKRLVDEINKHSFMVTCGSCEGHEDIQQHAFVNIVIKNPFVKKLLSVISNVKGTEILEFKATPANARAFHIRIFLDNKNNTIKKLIRSLRKL